MGRIVQSLEGNWRTQVDITTGMHTAIVECMGPAYAHYGGAVGREAGVTASKHIEVEKVIDPRAATDVDASGLFVAGIGLNLRR